MISVPNTQVNSQLTSKVGSTKSSSLSSISLGNGWKKTVFKPSQKNKILRHLIYFSKNETLKLVNKINKEYWGDKDSCSLLYIYLTNIFGFSLNKKIIFKYNNQRRNQHILIFLTGLYRNKSPLYCIAQPNTQSNPRWQTNSQLFMTKAEIFELFGINIRELPSKLPINFYETIPFDLDSILISLVNVKWIELIDDNMRILKGYLKPKKGDVKPFSCILDRSCCINSCVFGEFAFQKGFKELYIKFINNDIDVCVGINSRSDNLVYMLPIIIDDVFDKKKQHSRINLTLCIERDGYVYLNPPFLSYEMARMKGPDINSWLLNMINPINNDNKITHNNSISIDYQSTKYNLYKSDDNTVEITQNMSITMPNIDKVRHVYSNSLSLDINALDLESNDVSKILMK